MSQLKFRAWNNGGGYMVDSKRSMATILQRHILDYPDGGLDATGQHYKNGQVTEQDYTIMQSTGLLDKYGIEIYEGDIVQANDGWRGEVVYDEGSLTVGYSIKLDDGSIYRYHRLNSSDDLEVIGNVHDRAKPLTPEPER